MQSPFIVGHQIYLRALEETDIPVQVRWFNDSEINQHLAGGSFPLNLLQEREYVKKLYIDQSRLSLAIVLRESDEHIGGISLRDIHPIFRSASLGILIGEKDHWGCGYGTEATQLIVQHGFHTLNLNRIWLKVLESNKRAVRVYEKLGFSKEGVLRQDVFSKGDYHDTLVMGILREEWAI